MPQAAYPTATDLETFLAGAGITLSATLRGNAIAAGIAAFEGDTGRKMLAGAAETRYFRPPVPYTGVLDLGADVVNVTAVGFQPEGGSLEAYTVGTQYRLHPYNAAAEGKPYERVEFLHRVLSPCYWNAGRAYQVTGQWGYGTTIPDDAWQAMLLAGVLGLLDMYFLSRGGVVRGVKEGSASIDYAPMLPKEVSDTWRGSYSQAVARYTKVVI